MTDRRNQVARLKNLYRLWSWLTTPRAASEAKAAEERMLLMLLTLMAGMALISTILVFIGWRLGTHLWLSVVVLMGVEGTLALGWWLTRQGYHRFSKLLAVAIPLAAASFAISQQGMNSPLVLVFSTAILIAGMLYGVKTQWGVVLLSIVLYLGIGWTIRHEPLATFLRAAIHTSSAFVAIGLYQWFFIGKLQQTLDRSRSINEELNRQTAQQMRLLELAQSLTTDLQLVQLLNRMVHSARELLNAHGCTIYLLEADRKNLSPIVALDPLYEQEILATKISTEASLSGKAVQEKRAMIFNDPLSEEMAFQVPGTPIDTEERLILCPLTVQDEIIGTLNINRMGEPFTSQDLALAEQFASYASVAIKNARLLEQLSQSEKRFRLLAEHAQDMIYRYEFAPQRGFSYVSPSVTRISGYTPEEHYADPDLGLKIIHPEDLPLLEAYFQNKGTFETPLVLRWVRKDGTVLWTEQINTPIYDQAGNLIALEGIARDITKRMRIQKQLAESEHRLRSVLENVHLVAVMLDTEGNITFCNDFLLELTGWTRAQILGSNWLERFVPPEQISLQTYKEFIAQENIPLHYENDIVTRHGEWRRIAWSNTMLRDPENNTIIGVASIGEDITERIQAQQALQLHAQVFASASEAILISDDQGTVLTVNHAFGKIFGYSQDEVQGQAATFLQSEKHDESFYKQIWETLHMEGQWRGELWVRGKDGISVPTLTSINAVRDDQGAIVNLIFLANDITLLKATEMHLKHLATHDSLTDLPNRSLFYDRLSHALTRARRDGRRVAVLYLDLDEFKDVNDTYGHEVGDMVLKAVARRLQSSLRESDTVARLSGDEFIILLEDIKADEDVMIVAQNILRTLAQPYVINGYLINISASIGITFCSLNCNHPSEMIRQADAAMYHAKQAGKNTYYVYAP